MLELKNISKDYQVGEGTFRALDDISLKFRKGEFVAILGHSGCGKTTTLNIIGGLDRYSEGDLVINGTSTKLFTERDWDAYRNNSVGFIFQSYNLISHLSVLDNVELGLTLSGVNKIERRKRALEVLEKVGLASHIDKNPTLLSGGEKQRVAIARALVNNPDIMLADEPTGALDSKTAREILDLIKEISKDKLVIMVTHEAKYAEEYASRTIKLLDGKIIEDSHEYHENEEESGYVANKTAMSFWTALKLSFNNLRTKKFRTIITALASSIGIIGVGLVLSISNGFSGILDDLESDQLVGLPIIITEGEPMMIGPQKIAQEDSGPDFGDGTEIIVNDPEDYTHINIITTDLVNYLNQMDDAIYTTVQYNYGYSPLLLIETSDVSKPIDNSDINFTSYITPDNELDQYYEVLAGDFPQNPYEVTLLVKDGNIVDKDVIETLGLDSEAKINYDDILGLNLYVARNQDYFVQSGNLFIPQLADLDTVLDNGVELTITGIVKLVDGSVSLGGDNGIYYLYSLEKELINLNMNSDICAAQNISDKSVLTGENLTEDQKFNILSFLGCNNTIPRVINIYTDSVDNKAAIKDYIDEYNLNLDEDDQIEELDLAEAIGDTMGSIIDMISIILTAFASISLVVSSVMIGIIIYISVLERTKEIGIIRSLGGRKKDISRVFNAESIIIGAFAGILGVAITFLLTFPINIIVIKLDEALAGVAKVNGLHLIALVIISTILTFIGGFIPARIAAKKNPVEALRVE